MIFKTLKSEFTLVSGKIAKIGPNMMTVTTPVATVGIRVTKVAGKIIAESEANTISLLPNDDGTAVGSRSGVAPQILTAAGAMTTVLGQLHAPAAPVMLPQNQIQQQYGRYVMFQLAKVAVSKILFQKILALIDDLRPRPVPV